jgi:hypothetical protein
MSDMRDYIKFYGIYLDDWTSDWGGQTFNRHLLREWVSSATVYSTASSVWVNGGYSFIYPHHIKKKYLLEGVVEGEVTFGKVAHSHVSNYRVTIFKLNNDANLTDLVTTGIRTVVHHSVPANDVARFHFWIDAWNAKEIGEYDRLGLKVEWNVGITSTTTSYLYHDYLDGWGYDLWIDVPFILGD